MNRQRGKFSSKYASFFLPALLLLVLTIRGKDADRDPFFPVNISFSLRDTVPVSTADTSRKLTDTTLRVNKIDTLDIKLSKDSIDAPVNFHAEDSMVFDADTRKIYMYGKTDVKYKDIDLGAPSLELDQSTQTVTARMSRDTAGTVLGMAKLTQAGTVTVSDSIRFNFKTQKGLIHSTYFQQEELFNYAEKVKKVDSNTLFAYKGRFTTCNLDTPHFAFKAKKMKFVNNKVAVTGPVHPEFEGVPVPVYIPFGFFPLKRGRQSGILPPSLTITEDFGLGLEGLGYYKVINDYFDVTLRTDLYSYGSWRASITPSYRKRYRYSGNLNFSLQNMKFNFKGDPDYSENKGWFLTWSHRMDSKARPGVNFSASVNAGSSKYLSYVPYGSMPNNSNSSSNYYQPINFTNSLQSSISYQKQWTDKYNLTVNLNHSQNTNLKTVNLNLPDVAFTVNTIYPFQSKDFAGTQKWYQKLGVGYNGSAKSQISFYDTAFSVNQLLDTLQWGASHQIPIILALPQLGPFMISPSFSFQEKWYSQQFIRSWNDVSKKVDTTINKGFYRAADINVGLSVSTATFATILFKKESRVQAIRHVMRPQVGLSYRPDMMKPYTYRTQIDTFGRVVPFTYFDGSIYGPFSLGASGSIGFGIDNNIEMKLRSKKDTTEEGIKKIRLIDGFGVSSGYNLLADSFPLSPFSFYLRSNLFEKVNITATANMSPYQYDKATGFPINKYAWQGDDFSVGRITNGSLAISTQFQSKKADDKKESIDETLRDYNSSLTQDQLMMQLDYMRNNPSEFADFNIPWSLNLQYSLSFAQLFKPDYSGFETEFTSSISVQGDFNLTEKWKFGAYGFYDFNTNKVQSFTTFVSRDLHCWQMAINVNFAGRYKFFNISINPKSGLLRDLKVNRTRQFYSN